MRGSSSCIFLSYSSFKPKQRQSSDSKLQCFVGLYFMRSSRCSTQAVSFILLMKRISILTSLNCSRWVLKNIVSAFVTVMKHHLFKSFRRQREIWGVLKLPTNPTAGVRLINSEVGWIARRVKCGQVEREIRDPCRTVRALTLDEHKKEVPWTNETLVGPCSLAGRAQKG